MEIEYEDFKRRISKRSRKTLTPEIVDTINRLCDDDGEEFAEIYKSNVMSYIDIINGGKFSAMEYVSAVKYCSLRLLENSRKDSYIITFPDRVKRLRGEHKVKGYSPERSMELIGNFALAFNKGKLVNTIMEYMQVPDNVLNAPLRQKAINKLASLMMHSKSERIQLDSAKELIIATKGPEISKVELELNVGNDAIADLQASLGELAMKQKGMLEHGVVDLAVLGGLKGKTEIIEAEVELAEDKDGYYEQ